MIKFNDFIITSTKYDYELFFNTDYQRVVNKALQELATENKWTNVKGYSLMSYEGYITIETPNESYIKFLEDYNKDS